jgi:hypothetical protein
MAQMMLRPQKEPPLFRIDRFKGINVSSTPTQIDENQSPDMLNVMLDERGALNKRTGYERLYEFSLGSGAINGMFQFRKNDGTTAFLIAWGTTLYTQKLNEQPLSLYEGIANNSVKFFVMGGKCYIQDGTNFLVYDGTTVSKVEDSPYIPTLTISRPPAGGGEKYEDFNLLGAGFKDSFSGDGTATLYVLSLQGLDATTVTATVDGVAKTEGTDFTVDRTNGKVTFTTAPPSGTNNVIITAYKTTAGLKDRIKQCQFNILFGGSNDTYVFVSGNPNFKNQIWKCGVGDPTYWPENGFYKPGSDNEAVQGFAKQYDYLLIYKEFSTWNMQFQLSNGVSFPLKPINDQVGAIARESIQIIENNPVALDRKGLYSIVASNLRDERNVQHLSENVDGKLLKESLLENAVSIDYDRKYWLALNENVYVYDYSIQQWYVFNNIRANCFYVMNGSLYFGDTIYGQVYRFKKKTDQLPYNDDGATIQAYWYSKLLDFQVPERNKMITRIFYTLKPDVHTSANLYIRTDKKGEKFINTTRMDQLSFFNMDFNKFTFVVSDIPQEVAKKVKEKKITHFQMKLENNSLDESLGVISLGIKWNAQNEVK